jgi:hypothetical protein
VSVPVLIDMNLSVEWVAELARPGWSAVHWSAVGDPRADDAAIMAWALANGHAQHEPIRALAPLGLVIAIPVALAALGATVFARRRYMVLAVGTLSLAVGVTVASAGALITTSF